MTAPTRQPRTGSWVPVLGSALFVLLLLALIGISYAKGPEHTPHVSPSGAPATSPGSQ